MIYIFDFDYTLFDTSRFRRCLPKAFGVSENIYNASYKKYFTTPKIHYNIYAHISYLAKEGVIENTQYAKNNVLKILKSIDEFLFPEAEDLLARIKKSASSAILITRGDMAWQKMKTSHLKIKKYFDRIIITDKDKGSVLDFLKKETEKIIVINDNARECLDFKKVLRERVEIFLVKGPYSDNIKHNFKSYTLEELIHVLA